MRGRLYQIETMGQERTMRQQSEHFWNDRDRLRGIYVRLLSEVSLQNVLGEVSRLDLLLLRLTARAP